MARRRDGVILDRIRTLYNLGSIRELTDGQLLERFATDGDEAAELAFAALVERHEALVWRACLAITRDRHEAEDAFQATFLVLVRKARTLWVRDSLGPWLHQVACRTASQLRRAGRRRRERERRCGLLDPARSVDRGPTGDPELESILHEVVDRLPEKYRAAIVLCDLQGRTHREAARALGWPIGTVKTRQLQGRRLIRDRLLGRGLGAGVAGLAFGALGQPAPAAVPPTATAGTVALAMRHPAGMLAGSVVSARVLMLARGVIRAMIWNRIRLLATIVLAASLATGGTGLYVGASQEPGSGGPPTASPPAAGKAHEPKPSAPVDLQIRLRAQQLAVRKARALREMARLAREVAEINVEEYISMGFDRDLATVDGELKLAESDQRRLEDRVDWAQRMFDRGFVSKAQKVSEEVSLQQAKMEVEMARTKRKVLVDYTRGKTLKKLQSEVEEARAAELTRQAEWEAEEDRLKALEKQLPPAARGSR